MHINAEFSHQPFYRWHKTHFPDSTFFDSADRFIVMHQMIKQRLGIGLLPHYLGDGDPELAVLFSLPDETDKELWMLTHSDLRNAGRFRGVPIHPLSPKKRNKPSS
jgi:DNA-binding transcriptional LysR family regulator